MSNMSGRESHALAVSEVNTQTTTETEGIDSNFSGEVIVLNDHKLPAPTGSNVDTQTSTEIEYEKIVGFRATKCK